MDLVYIGRYNTGEILTGPEKVAKRIYENYTKKNQSLFVEYFFDGKKYGIVKKLFGKEKVECVNGSEVWRMGILPLFVILLKLQPKIIHIITFDRFAIVTFLCKMFFNVKVVYNIHGLIIHENKYFGKVKAYYNFKDKFVEEILVKYSDLLLLLSKSYKELLNSYYSVNKRKIKGIKNGIDREFIIAGEKRSKISENILKIVFIADINRPEKGFSFLKESLEKFNRDVELCVIDKKENADNVTFKNKLIKVYFEDAMPSCELASFLMDKNVFISASSCESYGLTGVECMATGLIPVLTKETGASELIKDGINGYVYDFGDGKRLNNILEKIIDDTTLKMKISGEAKRIYSELSWDKITENYLYLYKRII